MYLLEIPYEIAVRSGWVPLMVLAPMKVGAVLFPFNIVKSLSKSRSSSSRPLLSVSGDPHIVECALESIHIMIGLLCNLTYANNCVSFSGSGEFGPSQYTLVMKVFLPSILTDIVVISLSEKSE